MIAASEVSMILIFKPMLVSYCPIFVLVTKYLKNRFWEDNDAIITEYQSKLPPTKVSRDGTIMEWVSNYIYDLYSFPPSI